jgi:hypothetical protein
MGILGGFYLLLGLLFALFLFADHRLLGLSDAFLAFNLEEVEVSFDVWYID